MIQILLISSERDSFLDMAAALEENGLHTAWAESGNTALSMVVDKAFDLVITDETLEDMTGLEFAEKLISVNAMLNCAAVSSLSSEDFHEASEGMGILMQLPPEPGKDAAEKLLEHLKKILNLTNKTTL